MRMSDFLTRRMMSARQGATPIETLGRFSVSENKVVGFSRGNLQAEIDASGNPLLWKFAEHQYDYIGNAVANTSIGTTAGTIDLFGWSTDGVGASTDYKEWGINTSADNMNYQGNFKDWGSNPSLIASLGSDWRTLTGGESGEWKYLLSTRIVNGGTGEGKSYRRGTINSDATGVYGLIIYPDNYIAQTTATTYTTAEWRTMEAAGCVFLPAAGYRDGSGVDGVGSFGSYWSSSPSGSYYAYSLFFFSYDVCPANYYNRYYGSAVRLVKELN